MPDHVHVLVRPFENFSLQQIVHTWKSYSANRLQWRSFRINSVWQDEYFDRIVRDHEEFVEKAQYILNNPLKIMAEVNEYKWAWVKNLEEAGTEARPTEPGNSP